MPLERLKQVLPAPGAPSEPGSPGLWPDVEQSLGCALPTDYKDFIATYGSGSISQFAYVHNPFSANPLGNLMKRAIPILQAYKTSRSTFPASYRFPVYLEPNGIYPWGSTDNGDELFWITASKPDQWSVFLLGSRASAFEVIDTSMTNCLFGLLTGARASKVLSPRNILPPSFATSKAKAGT
jgi:hypothetical protein